MATRKMPERLSRFLHWVEDQHATEEVLLKIQAYLGEIRQEMAELQGEAQIVESLLGFLAEHHLPSHGSEPVVARHMEVVPREERGKCILEVAQEIVNEGQAVVTPHDIAERLYDQRLDLDVTYPRTVIGNVLARSPHFLRLGRNRFEYVGNQGGGRDTKQ